MSPLDIVRLSRARGGRVYSPPRGMTTRCGDAAFCQIYLDTGFSCIFNLRKIHSFLVVKVGHKAVTFFPIFSHCGKRIKRLNKLARSASGWEAIIAVWRTCKSLHVQRTRPGMGTQCWSPRARPHSESHASSLVSSNQSVIKSHSLGRPCWHFQPFLFATTAPRGQLLRVVMHLVNATAPAPPFCTGLKTLHVVWDWQIRIFKSQIKWTAMQGIQTRRLDLRRQSGVLSKFQIRHWLCLPFKRSHCDCLSVASLSREVDRTRERKEL